MERRPTWAKNFRRFGFKSLRSHSWAPSWRRNASLATSLLMEPGLSPEAPCPSHLRVDQGVRSLLCATARRTDKSYDSVGWLERRASRCASAHERGEREPSEHRAQGPVRACQASSSSKSRDRSIEKPRCSRTSVKCCEARLLASSVGLNLVRADLKLVRDKAAGRSRSCAQIARNEAEVAKCTKLKREPQAVCCPPPDGDEVSVGTRQRECSDQVIARDFLGKAGQPSQLSL